MGEAVMKLTQKEIELLKTVVKIELGVIQFMKGFKKTKTAHETNLEKILNKLNNTD